MISLENASGSVLWSWHLWAPKDNPLIASKQIEYQPEYERPMVNTVGYTNSGSSPIKTRFMDRNLGALYAFPGNIVDSETNATILEEAKNSSGMFYQWGRKDPLPSFKYAGNSGFYDVYKPILNNDGTINSWTTINAANYQANYVVVNRAATIESQALTRAEKIQQCIGFRQKILWHY